MKETDHGGPLARAMLDFWFHEQGDGRHGRPRDVWFRHDPAFDEALRKRFEVAALRAARGDFDEWIDTPRGALALVLLLDQVPRNLYRGTRAAFATDPKALTVARDALARGHDAELPAVMRWFLYLPFEHAEDPSAQARAVELFETLARQDPDSHVALAYARRHKDVIDRFGRFPDLNDIFGRESTPEEVAFLREPGSSLL